MGFKISENSLKKTNIIYSIRNLKNNKRYIGQTSKTIKDRALKNNLELRSNSRYNKYLIRSINKYGYENFQIRVLSDNCSSDELNKLEEFYIKKYKTTNPKFGYNSTYGGCNRKPNEELRQLLSIKCSGWKHTKQAKEKISRASKNFWDNISDDIKNDIKHKIGKSNSKALKGNIPWNKGLKGVIIVSEETKNKLSEIHKNRIITWGDKISKAKTKYKFDKDRALIFLKENPKATSFDLLSFLEIPKSNRIILNKFGGIKNLKKEAKLLKP